MKNESVFVLNYIEKQLAGDLIRDMDESAAPSSKQCEEALAVNQILTYEYSVLKGEKVLNGIILGSQYRLRYRDGNRIFFSTWNCTDACGLFYDVVMIVRSLANIQSNIEEIYKPFEVDLNVERYVFMTGAQAASISDISPCIRKFPRKRCYSSQYIIAVFDKGDNSLFEDLISKVEADDHSEVCVLQLWIRGEVLYYVLADGMVLRSEHQRSLTIREEDDIIRKTDKTVNDRFQHIKFQR
jgi:hypothetical protein